MKRILACLCFFSVILNAIPGNGQEITHDEPITIMSVIRGSVTEKMIADYYDMERYISRSDDTILIDAFEFKLVETAADPYILTTIIQCRCRDPEVELREWFGYDYYWQEADFEDVLTHAGESFDHPIAYIYLAPVTPYQEEALYPQASGNCLYWWSSGSKSRDDLVKCELNHKQIIHELYSIDIIYMEEGNWKREKYEVSYDIPIMPVVDRFILPTPVTFPEFDLAIETAGVYLTPFHVESINISNSLSGKKSSYHVRITGSPRIQIAEKLPDLITVSVVDESDTEVYHEKWIRKEAGLYEKAPK